MEERISALEKKIAELERQLKEQPKIKILIDGKEIIPTQENRV